MGIEADGNLFYDRVRPSHTRRTDPGLNEKVTNFHGEFVTYRTYSVSAESVASSVSTGSSTSIGSRFSGASGRGEGSVN